MKCKRPNCFRLSNRQGLCHVHYDRAPVRGYVDSTPTKERIELLLSRGVGWRAIKKHTGLGPSWWRIVGERVQALTEQKVFDVPVPDRVVAGGDVPALGTRRRIQALSAIGWPSTRLGERIGHNPRYLSQLLRRSNVQSRTAAKVDALYRELHMTPGPSEAARRYAAAHGWVPPLAWDDIDDPNETPQRGKHEPVSFDEKYRELRGFGLSDERIAQRLGIQPKSLERNLMRHKGEAA